MYTWNKTGALYSRDYKYPYSLINCKIGTYNLCGVLTIVGNRVVPVNQILLYNPDYTV